jgi:N-acetylglucosamine-6-sulfatase
VGKRLALASVTLVLLGLGLLAPAQARGTFPAAAAESRPNIVVIMTDDMRADEMENMPNLTALAAQGVTFTQAFVPNSLCCPSRTSTLTGQFSSRTGVWTNSSPTGGFLGFKAHESQTIAVWLHDAGYRTGLVGKYLNSYSASAARSATDPSGLRARPGWDAWHAFVSGPAYYTYKLNDDGVVHAHGTLPGDYSTDVLGATATAFVREAPAEQPYFLYFAPYGPHGPFKPAPGDATSLPNCLAGTSPPGCYQHITRAAPGMCPVPTGLPPYCSENIAEADVNDKPAWVRSLAARGTGWDGTRKKQEQTLLAVDRQVGAIVAAVEARGDLANTIFVFTSDNGLSGGSHRWGPKQSPWDEATNVPMVVRFDPLTGGISSSVDGSHMVLNADLAPTLLELAGVSAPLDYVFDGQSWVSLLSGTPTDWRTAFPLVHLEHLGPPPSYCGVRTDGAPQAPGRWLYVRYATGETELYDLSADPFELNSLASTPGYEAAVGALDELTRQLCDPAPPGYTWG